jgi:transposase-like protein
VPAVSKRKTTQKKRAGTTGKRPQDWSAEAKLQVVLEAAALSDDELGEFLRRKGLHDAQLEQWREQLERAAPEVFGSRRRAKVSPEVKRIRELEKELLRKDKALAEAAALIVLKKKALAIWGDEDDDTDPRSGT